ncbi:antitoxin [Streptomyces sp. BE20]|uniref:antitoxin n=1 Tax=Streptomycetaceae TaxID=2062 RepID=UPI002E76A058|nr:antitoxin [Streptomyces sp. BE20]MEE1825079.1 antitoxin [Streptomyces sp. BE20]
MFENLKNIADKATDLAREHSGAIGQGLDKVADVIDGKTDGKYSDKIDTATGKAKDFIRGLDESKKPAE